MKMSIDAQIQQLNIRQNQILTMLYKNLLSVGLISILLALCLD